MHVVVTGAGGFVGGCVSQRLAARGFAVTAISRGRLNSVSGPDVTWRSSNLLERDCLPPSFDALIHCAAELPSRTPDPESLYRLNATMARNVFDGARKARARSIVFLSSMSVYGRIAAAEVREDTPPDNPDAYGRAKRDAEDMLEAAIGEGVGSGLAIRLPGTVGKGSHHNFLSDSLARILAGEVVRAQNPDASFNNIVHARDLAAFVDAWLTAPQAGYTVTNLAATEPMTIREVLGKMFSLARRPERIAFGPTERPAFLISLDRARSLGYCPATVHDSVTAFVRDVVGVECVRGAVGR